MRSSKHFEIKAEVPNHDEGILHRLLEGYICDFPGNVSISQYFTSGFSENRIEPGNVAITQDEKRYTFGELKVISDHIAEILKEALKSTRNQNPDNDSVIGICIPPSIKLIFVLFAIHKIGACYVPIDVSFPERRVFKIVTDCKPLLIVSDHRINYISKFDIVKEQVKVMSTQDLMSQVDDKMAQEKTTSKIPILEEVLTCRSTETEQLQSEATVKLASFSLLLGSPVLAERTAVILYTSGSSGESKGVRLSHRAVMNRLCWQWKEFPYEMDEICVFKTSMTFVDSVAEIFGLLLQGYPLVIFEKHVTSQQNIFMGKLNHFKITRVTVVPSLLRAIFQTLRVMGNSVSVGITLLSSVKLWICSGEPLSYDLLSEFFELFPRNHTLANFYGSTELLGDVTYVAYTTREETYKKVMDKRVPIGLPIYNTVLYVLDKDMNMTETGQIGEIYVAGYNLATNYVGDISPNKFVENTHTRTGAYKTMFGTGDFGRISLTQDGTRMLFYEGRVDSQVKVRGQRIDLAEVELALSEIHLISKVVVLCFKPGHEEQVLLAYVVPSEPTVTLERLEPMIAKRLRDYERPLIKFIDQVPLLINGKTDRQRLIKMYEKQVLNREEFEDWQSLNLPADKLDAAKVLLKVISEVTGTSMETLAENIDNSFYNVGGTSLNTVVVIIKLRQHNLFISVGKFANAKTIRHVIMALSEMPVVDDDGEKVESDGILDDVYKCYYNSSSTISYSFSTKGDLVNYTQALYDEFRSMLNCIWKDIVGKGLSFMVRRTKDQKCVGVSFNFDVYDEPENVARGKACNLFLIEFIESRQRQKLPKGKGKLLHSFMMGTSEDIDEAESVTVIEFMENHIILMGHKKKFMGVLTTNTSLLTRQINVDIHGYEVLNEYQVNKYTAPDGTKPFLLAPDSFAITCCWKQISGNKIDIIT